MPVTKPTLEEWFFIKLYRTLWRSDFYCPATLNADLTEIAREFRDRGERVPYTAILLQAIAQVIRKNPAVNRLVFHTFYGPRILQLRGCDISYPVMFEWNGQTKTRLETLRDVDRMSLSEIRAALRAAKTARPDPESFLAFCLSRPNTLLNRMRLRGLFVMLRNFPSLVEPRRPAAVSLSSLVQFSEPGLDCRGIGYGGGSLSFTLTSVVEERGRVIARIGVGYNHLVCRGDEALAAIRDLARILRSGSAALALSLEEGAADERLAQPHGLAAEERVADALLVDREVVGLALEREPGGVAQSPG